MLFAPLYTLDGREEGLEYRERKTQVGDGNQGNACVDDVHELETVFAISRFWHMREANIQHKLDPGQQPRGTRHPTVIAIVVGRAPPTSRPNEAVRGDASHASQALYSFTMMPVRTGASARHQQGTVPVTSKVQ